MKNKYSGIVNARLVNKRALGLMLAGSNYMTLVFSTVICIATSVIPYMVFALISEFMLPWFSFTVLFLLEFMIFVPMVLGARRVAILASRGTRADIGELFFAFRTLKAYVRSLFLAAFLLIKFLLPIVVALFGSAVMSAMLDMTPLAGNASNILSCVFGVALFALMTVLISRFYGVAYVMLSDEDGEARIRSAIAESFRFCRKRCGFTVLSRIRMLPMTVVSVLLVMIPFVLFAMPYMMFAYGYRCRMICENTAPRKAVFKPCENEENEEETESSAQDSIDEQTD